MVTLFTSHTEAVNNAGEAASEIILLLFLVLILLPIVPCLAAGLPLHQTPHLLAKTDHHHQRREIRHLVFLFSLHADCTGKNSGKVSDRALSVAPVRDILSETDYHLA